MQRTEPPVLARHGSSPMPMKARMFEEACCTPGSQVSTAPPTPFQGWSLPDSHHELLDGIMFSRLHSAESSTFDAHEELEAKRCIAVSVEAELGVAEASTDDSELEGEYESSDDLCGAVLVDDPENIVCVGMPPLQSELGKWAQRVAAAEEWLEEKISTKFIVDNSNLKALTVGIAFRFSKNVNHRDRSTDGPHWGSTVTGVDQGDGWVKVGLRFLPKMLDGQPVLLPLAAQGNHLVSMGGAKPKVFSINAHGVVHGAPAAMRCFPGSCKDVASRLRRFHARRVQRRLEAAVCWGQDLTVCVDTEGKVSTFLYLFSDEDRMERRRCKWATMQAAHSKDSKDVPGYVFSVGTDGVVQEWLAPGERL